jgi:hypothetical protein
MYGYGQYPGSGRQLRRAPAMLAGSGVK